jgi:hypothetical protein
MSGSFPADLIGIFTANFGHFFSLFPLVLKGVFFLENKKYTRKKIQTTKLYQIRSGG